MHIQKHRTETKLYCKMLINYSLTRFFVHRSGSHAVHASLTNERMFTYANEYLAFILTNHVVES